MNYEYDVVVLGAGPAGLAAALGAYEKDANTLIIERENRPGGILKQCIHDGFGLITFKEKLTGPEYAERYIKLVREKNIPIWVKTYVTDIKKEKKEFIITLVNNKKGVFSVKAKAIVMANGCRERTAKQVFIHGSRPSGIYTAGTVQYFVNIQGYLPCNKCVILGSGDIGLIMARRLTLEGTKVIGVYEAKSSPSGLTRNLIQCLEDYNIPLHLSYTITRVYGEERVEGVEIAKVDEKMNIIEGTEEKLECDGVILSVGLIPENEIAEKIGVKLDSSTKGPIVDQFLMTNVKGAFSCGNALHVNDLVDYVSESGKLAGENAAVYSKKIKLTNGEELQSNNMKKINIPKELLYVVPQNIDINSNEKKIILYFRSKEIEKNVKLIIKYGERIHFMKKYSHLKPPEMERIELELSNISFNNTDELSMELIRE